MRCKIASPVPFLVMKGTAIGRGKPKDGYDIELEAPSVASVGVCLAHAMHHVARKLICCGWGLMKLNGKCVENLSSST